MRPPKSVFFPESVVIKARLQRMSHTPEPPPNIKPTNYISITRRMGEVHGTFVLDPTLRVPQSMQARKPNKTHLRFSALMGEVSAEVYVVGAAPSGSDKTRMEVSSTLGSVSLKLHAVEPRAPLMITVSARMGEVVLRLPRSFRGPLRLSTTMGDVELSAALRAAATTFGDGRMFVGAWTEEELTGAWAGDEAVVDTRMGSVSVGYEDEGKL